MNNEQFVKELFNTYLNQEVDELTLWIWTDLLDTGYTDREELAGWFAYRALEERPELESIDMDGASIVATVESGASINVVDKAKPAPTPLTPEEEQAIIDFENDPDIIIAESIGTFHQVMPDVYMSNPISMYEILDDVFMQMSEIEYLTWYNGTPDPADDDFDREIPSNYIIGQPTSDDENDILIFD